MARNNKMIAGKIVHTVSMCCASKRYRFVSEFMHKISIAYLTTDITRVKIISV